MCVNVGIDQQDVGTSDEAEFTCRFNHEALTLSDTLTGTAGSKAFCEMMRPLGVVKHCPAYNCAQRYCGSYELSSASPVGGNGDPQRHCSCAGSQPPSTGPSRYCEMPKLVTKESVNVTKCAQLGDCGLIDYPEGKGALFFALSCDFSPGWMENRVVQGCTYQIRYDPLYHEVYALLPGASVMLNALISAVTDTDEQTALDAAKVPDIMKNSHVPQWTTT